MSAYVHYLYLGLAIILEIVGTTALKATMGFTRPLATIITLLAYCAAFYFLSLTLKTMPTGIVYAIWSGVGIVFISLISWLFYKQTLDTAALVGMAFIVAGVVIMNAFSKSISH